MKSFYADKRKPDGKRYECKKCFDILNMSKKIRKYGYRIIDSDGNEVT